MRQIKKAYLLPLEGKYYGTKVRVEFTNGESVDLSIWFPHGEPSEREKPGLYRDMQNMQTLSFIDWGHYESEESLYIATSIVDLLNNSHLTVS